jgi:hypothetical protein
VTSRNRPARLNRVILALIGVVLLTVGAFAVATHLGELSIVDRGATLVPGTALPPTWAWYATAGGGLVVGLLALRWLAAQLVRAPRAEVWRFEEDPDHGRTSMSSTTAVAPFLTDIGAYPGVQAAHGTLTGALTHPTLVLVVGVEQDGDLTAIRERVTTHGLPRLCQALDLDEIPTSIEFRFTGKQGARVQ